ncbi:MAG: Cu(I)-responsive transcriptional regulator [Alphaproteobacteria bacterium]|nr:Cu(I)-responsive transcriptional regulator [Alphaproteobacteria bacterium]
MNIGEVSKKSGLPAKTIRYYESIGLLPKPHRSEGGYRVYTSNDLMTLRFVQRARRLGFSVGDVENLLALWRDQHRSSSEVKKLAIQQIGSIDQRIRALENMRGVLIDLTERCHGDERPDCPILDDLADDETEDRFADETKT